LKTKDVAARLSDLHLTRLPKAHEVQTANSSPKEELEKRRAVFERIVDDRARSVRQKHEAERVEMTQRQSDRLDFTKKHLADYYGLAPKKAALVALRDKIKRAPLWKKALGLTRNEIKTFREQARTYKSARGRYRERMDKIVGENRKALEVVKARQDSECRDMDNLFALQREALFGPVMTREQTQERTPGVLTRAFAAAHDNETAKNLEKTRDDRTPSRSNSYRRL
jgi:hypothetical protein